MKEENGKITGAYSADNNEFAGQVMEKAYTTDFLTDRAIDFIKEQKEQKRTFALMLSLPDPHGKLTMQAGGHQCPHFVLMI